jgi:plastocyanin
VTADDGSFDSKGLGQGDTFSEVFSSPGRHPYHCAAHPFMKGVVIVSGEATR